MTLLLVQHCYKTIIFQHTVYLMLTFWDHLSRSSLYGILSGILSWYGAGNCSHSLTFWLGSWGAFAKYWASQLAVLLIGLLLTNLCSQLQTTVLQCEEFPVFRTLRSLGEKKKKSCNSLFLVSFLAGCRCGVIVHILTRGVIYVSFMGRSLCSEASRAVGWRALHAMCCLYNGGLRRALDLLLRKSFQQTHGIRFSG